MKGVRFEKAPRRARLSRPLTTLRGAALLAAGASLGALAAAWLSVRALRSGNGSTPVDLDALQGSLAEIAGSEDVHLRDLGEGIVEALGAAPDAEVVEQVLATLRAGSGVSVVVNRIWTQAPAPAATSRLPRSSPFQPEVDGN